MAGWVPGAVAVLVALGLGRLLGGRIGTRTGQAAWRTVSAPARRQWPSRPRAWWSLSARLFGLERGATVLPPNSPAVPATPQGRRSRWSVNVAVRPLFAGLPPSDEPHGGKITPGHPGPGAAEGGRWGVGGKPEKGGRIEGRVRRIGGGCRIAGDGESRGLCAHRGVRPGVAGARDRAGRPAGAGRAAACAGEAIRLGGGGGGAGHLRRQLPRAGATPAS
jgi:hypothetical protein